MNFWATIEHSLNYKYSGNIPEKVKLRLQRASEAASRLDMEMSEIRGEIQEAQAAFSRKKKDEDDDQSGVKMEMMKFAVRPKEMRFLIH